MYTAVIIEPRKHKALSFVLKNFLMNLSNEWNMIVFHGNKNIEYINDIINKELIEYKNRIQLTNLNVDNISIHEYNNLLKSVSFYDNIPTETFLVFQTDTMIFPKNKNLIHHFLQYDYVGAPWDQSLHWINNYWKVGNGGFSLRKKSKMIEIINFKNRPEYEIKEIDEAEDMFFSGNHDVYVNKPSFQEAKLFSVETEFSEITLGCHCPWKYVKDKIIQYYPEVLELMELQSTNDS
jgi:hypothetical protein